MIEGGRGGTKKEKARRSWRVRVLVSMSSSLVQRVDRILAAKNHFVSGCVCGRWHNPGKACGIVWLIGYAGCTDRVCIGCSGAAKTAS